MKVSLDKFDIMILEELQKDSSISTNELADKIGLTQSPCWRRLQRIKDEKLIKKDVSILDRSKFNTSIYIFSTIKMTTLSEKDREIFIQEIDNIPEILECHTLFGEMDILLKVLAPTVEWYQELIFKKIQRLPGVVNIQSSITLKELKSTTELPLRNLVN